MKVWFFLIILIMGFNLQNIQTKSLESNFTVAQCAQLPTKNKDQTNLIMQKAISNPSNSEIINWVNCDQFKSSKTYIQINKPVNNLNLPKNQSSNLILNEIDNSKSSNITPLNLKNDLKHGYFITPQELFGQNLKNDIHNSDFLEKLNNLLNPEHNFLDYLAISQVITSLKAQISNDNHNGKLRVILSIYEYLAGDIMGSSLEAKRAIALMSMDYLPHLILGLIFDETNEHELAISEIKRAIAMEPKQAIIHEYLAKSYLNAGDLSQAINEFRRSITISPRVSALAYLSQALLTVKDNYGALKAARIAESINHGSAIAQIALSRALLANDENQSALRTARQAILLDPMLAQSHMVLGRAYAANGQATEALDELKQAVNLEPLNAQARNDLGFLLYKQNDLLQAINELRLALRLNPSLAEARNNLEIAIFGFSQDKKNKSAPTLKFLKK